MRKDSARASEIQVARSLMIFVGFLAVLWAFGILMVEVQSRLLHRAYPYDTLLFIKHERFSDFTIFYPKLKVFGNRDAFFSESGYPFTYPAPLLLFFVTLYRLTPQPLAEYLVIVCVFAGFVAFVSYRSFRNGGQLSKRAALAGVLPAVFSLPLFFLLDRANIEGVVWMAATFGLYCFTKRYYKWAAAFLALATAMKVFPALLLFLFLAKRRYWDFFLSAVLTAIFTLAALWLTGPSILRAAQGIVMGLDYQRRFNVLQFRASEIGFDHSLFSFLKWITLFRANDRLAFAAITSHLLQVYLVSAFFGFLAIYLISLRHLPVLNQVLVLSILSVTLPYCSFEYTLVHLTVPFILLVFFLITDVATGRIALRQSQMMALLMPFVLVFGPLSFMILVRIGLGGQLKALALVYLVWVVLTVRMPSSLFGELDLRADRDAPALRA